MKLYIPRNNERKARPVLKFCFETFVSSTVFQFITRSNTFLV